MLIILFGRQETGKDLFADFDSAHSNQMLGDNSALLYRMATDDSYLKPLRAFQKRRLYANLNGDFVVPLGTAAFLEPQKVQELRSQFASSYGIVTTLTTDPQETNISPQKTQSIDNASKLSSATPTYDCVRDSPLTSIFNTITQKKAVMEGNDMSAKREDERKAERAMSQSLDKIGWEKVLVHFRSPLPLSHNKICALTKYPGWLNSILGFDEGQFVMQQAADWLLNDDY